ncbi:hypothetical protein ABZ424_34070 [Streptomyces sp. NPDC005790]|uniref:hypothetical protein n=1 Tax=Streptomyces sp. NPDC005790 TaxID=3154777 RepID=UPI0033F8EE85
MTTLIAAGALSTGFLGIGSTSTASASTPPHTSAHQAITQDLKPLVAINNWLLGVAGAPAEYLPQVSGLTEHAVTFDRRPGASAIVDTWLRDPSRFGRSTSPSTCSTLREPELHVSSSIARRSRGW